ncbi:unnamed protein product, partial [Chrysoparadoxa australica]
MEAANYRRVADVGTGSGDALLQYLGRYDTLGLERGPALQSLYQVHPARSWAPIDYAAPPIETDLLLCSGLMERMQDPKKLLEYLKGFQFKKLLIATADRAVLTAHPHLAASLDPPANPGHVQEWTRTEFAALLGQYFTVVE